MGIPRTLTLHESALSPSEYAIYIPLFDDLVDADVDAPQHNGNTGPNNGGRPGNVVNFNANANVTVPVREARGWLKGRYPGVESPLIDRILRIFHPALLPTDMLSQPQFFAVLRLLAHAHANVPGSRSDPLESYLVFVQPPDISSSAIATSSLAIGPTATSIATTPGISARNSNNPFNARSNTSTPAKNPPPNPPNTNTNTTTTVSGRPFSNSISHSASALSSDEGSVPDFVNSGGYGQVHGRASSSPAPIAPNPFLARANSIPQSAVGVGVGPISPPPESQQPTHNNAGVVVVPPALPPRKPSFLPPPRHASQQGHGNGSIGSTSTTIQHFPPSTPVHSKEPPLKPPKPPMHTAAPIPVPTTGTPATAMQSPVVVPGHVSSPLIKQGLAAAKGAQRSAEQGLEKLRMWEVIKSSSNVAPNGSAGSGRERERERAGSISSGGGSQQRALSGERGPNGTIRIQSTTRHARGISLAGGGIGPYGTTEVDVDEEGGPFVTPTSTGLISPLSSVAPSSPVPYRVARSRSLHASSSPTANNASAGTGTSDPNASTSISPPVPPPRRRRPESVQVGWRREGEEAGPFADGSRPAVASDHVFEHGAASHPNPMASIQRGFHHLQAKTRPGLESARAKVEGKLMPGGYGKWGSESLTGGGGGGGGGMGVLRRKESLGPGANTNRGPIGGSSEGSDEFEDADEVLSTDDDVRKNGWKPLKG